MTTDRWKLVLALAAAVLTFLTGWFAPSPVAENTDIVLVPVEVPQVVVPAATPVDGPDADRKPDDALPLDDAAQDIIEAAAEDPPVDGSSVDQARGELQDLREDGDGPAGVIEGPLAAQEWPGCRTAFVRNFSSRGGVDPQVIVWHQTVSRENGQSSQNALTAMANTPSSQVSWHFLIGRSNGLCTFTVPTGLKAWTQANANPFAVGIEVEAYGDEGLYVTGAGREKLLDVTQRIGKLYGIPMQRGIVRNCVVIRPGVVEHKDLDQDPNTCAGGHGDVNLEGTDELIAELARRAAGKRSIEYLTKWERRNVECLKQERRIARRHGGWGNVSPSHLAHARQCKGELVKIRQRLKGKGDPEKRHRRERLHVMWRVVYQG